MNIPWSHHPAMGGVDGLRTRLHTVSTDSVTRSPHMTSHAHHTIAKSPTASTSSSASSLPTPTSGDAVWNTLFNSSPSARPGQQLHNPARASAHHHSACDDALSDLLFPRSDKADSDECNKCDTLLGPYPHAWQILNHGSHASCPSAPMVFEPCADAGCSLSHLDAPSSCCENTDARDLSSFLSAFSHANSHDCCPSDPSSSLHPACSATHCSEDITSCLAPKSACIPTACADPVCEEQHMPADTARPPRTHVSEVACNECAGGCGQSVGQYNGCGTCAQQRNLLPDPGSAHSEKDIYQSFQELLDCCYCSDSFIDPCCSPHSSAALGTGTVTPTTVDGSVTPTALFDSDRHISGTAQWHLPGHIADESSLILRPDCVYTDPHCHDRTGVCLDPPFNTLPTATTHARSQPGDGDSLRASKTHACRWAGCDHAFETTEELVRHFHDVHLPTTASTATDAAATPKPGMSTVSQLCQWEACTQPHQVIEGIAQEHESEKVASAMLQHLLQTHIGLSPDPHAFHAWDPLFAKHTRPQPKAGMPTRKQLGQVVQGSSEDSETAQAVDASYAPSPCATTASAESHHRCGWVGCDAVFPSHQALTDHIANDHVGGGKSLYSCGWEGCTRAAEGKTFAQRQKILRHIQTHTGDRPFKCDLCSRRFSEANTLAQHMRTHTREKPYVCDYPGCGAAFAVAGSLTIHKRSRHTLERPFVCTWPGCGRAFAESSNLTKHRRVHSGERPFPCKLCERKFSRPDQLQRHMKVHDVSAPGEAAKGPAVSRSNGDTSTVSAAAASKRRKTAMEEGHFVSVPTGATSNSPAHVPAASTPGLAQLHSLLTTAASGC